MAEMQTSNGSATSKPEKSPQTQPKKGRSVHEIHALPAPIRTFPLPTFYPNNPVSLLHIVYAWLGQVFSPPAAEPAVIHHGTWSPSTGSVHVTDEKSMTALWEQGFYGKGNLSRSEPNWLKREEVRRGLKQGHVSEIHTDQRRVERQQAKWERARLEQEEIRLTRERELQQAEIRLEPSKVGEVSTQPQPTHITPAPVGPSEILALPNSDVELVAMSRAQKKGVDKLANGKPSHIAIPDEATNGHILADDPFSSVYLNGALSDASVPHSISSDFSLANGKSKTFVQTQDPVTPSATPHRPGLQHLKRQKNVRFSPKVESNTFILGDPPSPSHSFNGHVKPAAVSSVAGSEADQTPDSAPIVNKEHLQLMPEEALWLTFGLGALAVSDPDSGKNLSARELLTLFRQHCFFPPRNNPDDPDLQPDDAFLIHYAVYHHFRSLGWVPRGGIKFGVDWLLYTRGPVFDHAEFGLMVIPSYSDPWWKAAGKQHPQKSWKWLHSIIRVLSHVTKSLVLIYVDVPPPSKFNSSLEKGIAEALKLYKVREVMVKRWSTNRNR